MRSVTGIEVRETVPDWVLQTATEIVMIDLTPEALHNRLKRGDIYRLEKVEQSLRNFFRRGNLIALRELALRQAAEHVDRNLESYMVEKEIKDTWPVRERICVCVSSDPHAQYLVARAARMARRMDAELYVAHVQQPGDPLVADQKSLEATLTLAKSLGAKAVRLNGKDVPSTLAAFSREKHITQAIFGRSSRHGWKSYGFLLAVHRYLAAAPPIDIHIVTQDGD